MRAIRQAIRCAVPVLGGLWVSSCGAGTWAPTTLNPGVRPPREHVRVWAGRKSYDWHAVRVTADSVSGVPFFQHPRCDSCRVAVPLAAVDSVQSGGEFVDDATQLAFVGLTFVLSLLFVGVMVCVSTKCLAD